MYLSVGVGLVAAVNALLGLFAILRSSRNKTNWSFASFAFVTSVWMLANYIGANFKQHAYSAYFVHADFFLGAWMAYTFWLFTRNLIGEPRPRWKKLVRTVDCLLLIAIIAASFGTFSPTLFSTSIVSGQVALRYGSLFNVYGLVLLVAVLMGLLHLFLALRRAEGRLHNQIVTMLFGLAIFVLLVATPNLIVPLLTSSKTINLYAGDVAYLGILSLVAISFYSIIKHRLFDIRIAIVRTVAFLFTVSFVAVIYSLLILGIGLPFVNNGRIQIAKNLGDLALLIPPTIFAAVTFHSIQKLVVRATSRIFYQGLFDLQEELDRFSDVLVGSSSIDDIMQGSLTVIREAIHPSHSYFIVFDNAGRTYRTISRGMKAPSSIAELVGDTKNINSNPVVRDTMSDADVPRSFLEFDILLALRLGSKDKPVGILLFGQKQNGRTYTRQDIDLLRIGAKNLAVALENAKKYDEISHFADTMHREVLRATADLRAANKELKSLDILKDDFISMASHQLRTPASSVHEALQMLNHATMPLTKAERLKLIELAEASSEHLVTVVADMLSISRIQAGHFVINKSSTKLGELLEKVVRQTSVLAEQKRIKLHIDRPNPDIVASVDMAKINEAMSNYIENAIKYSPEKTTVSIRLVAEDKRIVFEVSDQGMGVPNPERNRLFGKFFRAGNARDQQPDGNGIGLFVVRSIAKGHGGDAYYKPLPRGSLFGIWFPIDYPEKL